MNPIMELPIITTERLELKPLNINYAEQIFQYASDKENTRYMLYAFNSTIEETKEFLKSAEVQWALWPSKNQNVFEFGIFLKSTDTLIGSIDFELYSEPFTAEFGWVLNKKYHKQGYATEAGFAILNFAKTNYKIKTFIAHCDKRNIPSFNLMKKLGMSLISDDGKRIYPKTGEEAFEIMCKLEL